MIDHAEVVIGDWPVRGTGAQVLRFEDAIKEVCAVTNNGIVVPVFGATKRSNDARWIEAHLSTGQRGNIAYQTRPIVGGKLNNATGSGRVPRQTPGEHVRLGLDAHLNINHFLMAQNVRWTSRLDRQRLISPLATAIEGAPASSGTEYCLTDDMNLLIGPDPLYRYALSKPAEDHFMDTLHLIETFITSELLETADSYGVSVGHAPYYSLRKIEFVWEFAHPNPIRFVEGLDVPMRALGPESRRHRALVRGESLRVKQDSLSISAELSAGCDLVVYAKTNERIRFEVRFDRDAIGATLRKGRGDAKRKTRNHEDLRQMLATLREAATERMQTALAILDRQQVSPASDVTALRLCAEVGRILQDDALAHAVLETLRMRRSLASPLNSTMRGAADRLIAANVLRRSAPRSPVFIPTDRYVRAVEELRGYGAPPPALDDPASVSCEEGALPRGGIKRRRNLPPPVWK
jgi:hypothetical protein